MEKSEIEKLPAGAEVDLLVAQLVMKWPVIGANEPFREYKGYGGIICNDSPGMFQEFGTIPKNWHPSINISDAWAIVQLRGSHWEVSRGRDVYQATCVFFGEMGEGTSIARAETAPLAICRAALLAVTSVANTASTGQAARSAAH
jgi:hypothetical protein